MNIEEVREYCLSLPHVTEDLFHPEWLTFRIEGKWFVLIWLNAPQPTIEVKLPPQIGEELRERFEGINPGYHMNKKHWNDIWIESGFTEEQIKKWIKTSYDLVTAGSHKNKEREKHK